MSSIERPGCYTAEEWKNVKGQFDTDFKRYNDHIKSFNTLINEILDGETEGTFAEKTGLSHNMFSRIRKYVNKKDQPQKSTLISIAVGYKLDFQITARLLESLGSGFNGIYAAIPYLTSLARRYAGAVSYDQTRDASNCPFN